MIYETLHYFAYYINTGTDDVKGWQSLDISRFENSVARKVYIVENEA
jgi:hypothetical protein